MDELGNDLLLLGARPDGTLALSPKLRYGLSGSELVRLAAAGRVDIVRSRITILNTAPTGDPLLDEALASMTIGRRSPTAKTWVARLRPGLVEGYLVRAEAAGTVRAERGRRLGFIPVTRWRVVDAARAAQARARLAAIATSTGAVGQDQAALAGLAAAIGADRELFPGWGGAAARKRLRDAGKREPVTTEVARAASGAADASAAAANAATKAAVDAAVSAATQAAVSAAVDAATQAAVSAAATDAGAAGGHHHH
jgi:Golgi phosphoprotein 3 (GPP34)